MDNSPMYDCTPPNAGGCGQLFNTSSGLMQLYDVGFASHFVAEADALAELAGYVGRPDLQVASDRVWHFENIMLSGFAMMDIQRSHPVLCDHV